MSHTRRLGAVLWVGFYAAGILCGWGTLSIGGQPDRFVEQRNEPDYVDGWILVRLVQPLDGRTESGEFPLATGKPSLDAMIASSGVHRISSALGIAGRAPRSLERFRRLGLDRDYKFHVPPGSDIPAVAGRFDALAEVELAEPDGIATGGGTTMPNDPLFSSQYAYDQPSDADVDGPEGWNHGVGQDVIIAVLDTGFDSDHVDLDGKMLPGYDFVNNDDDPEDDHGHGTNVNSITSAESNNLIGVTGACWNCKNMPIKVLAADNSGIWSNIAAGLIWATDHGAHVINTSLGGTSAPAIIRNAVQYAYAAGVIHVSITHNDNTNSIRFPGRYFETIAIGGTDANDDRAVPFCYSVTSGSNYGPEIDVVAPGELILGAAMGGGYNYWCGTSQAAPLVAGMVGIMRTFNPSLGREEARHLLRSGADDEVGRPTEDTPGFDIYHGWGRVNMDNTLAAAKASITLHVDGQSATRLYYETANPIASSYDFLRGNLGALAESDSGVTLGSVVCIENDSVDPDTAGDEDVSTPAPGQGYFYLGRFNGIPGAGSYGGSSHNRDRIGPILGNCPS